MAAWQQAIDMITHVVRAISSLLTQQNLIGFDFRDARVVLENGGRAVFAEGHSSN
jgi:cell division GTPase FtsZ